MYTYKVQFSLFPVSPTHSQSKPQLKVKFAEVNEYIDHGHYGNASEQDNSSSGGRKGQSPSHKASGHPSPPHSGHPSSGHSSYGSPGHSRQYEDHGTSHLRDQ